MNATQAAEPRKPTEPVYNGLRGRLQRLINGAWFQWFIIAVILINAIGLGVETYELTNPTARAILQILDMTALAIFTVEILMRLYVERWRFIRDGWNWFDVIIVGVSLVAVIFNDIAGASVLRGLRVLRMLRIITAVESLKRVVNGLLNALPGMSEVVVMLAVALYMSAVMTTQLFGNPAEAKLEAMGYAPAEAQAVSEWVGAGYPENFPLADRAPADPQALVTPERKAEFDEVASLNQMAAHWGSLSASTYTLLQLMTLEGWPDIVSDTMEQLWWSWIFFLLFIIITAFAVLNLFIGIIVDAMSLEDRENVERERMRAEAERGGLMRSNGAILEKEEEILAVLQALRQEVAELKAKQG